MSSLDQAKAEAQKLIKRYNKLQAEVKTADSSVEAARKAKEAQKLVSQISAMQAAIAKLQEKDKVAEATIKAVAPNSDTALIPSVSPLSTTDQLRRAEAEKTLLEARIARIETAQQKTRAQIDQLSRAKAELAKLKAEAEKNKDKRSNDEKLQQELTRLIEKKEEEQRRLQEEVDNIRQQSVKEAELLRVQRDTARALMEKQKEIEKEKIRIAFRPKSGIIGIMLGLALVVILFIALVVIIFLTPLLDSVPLVANLKKVQQPPTTVVSTTETSPEKEPVIVSKPVIEEVQPVNLSSISFTRDKLKNGFQGPPMAVLPGGTFMMGSSDSSINREERPQHKVVLTPFAISRYEISFADYDQFTSATNRTPADDNQWGRGNRPVINVSFEDALAYTTWLTEQTGYQYRLPSEREWEFAARASTTGSFWWGYQITQGYANCGGCGSQWDGKQTAPVGIFKPNPFGIYDTVGNVMEWTMTCFRNDYQGAPQYGQNWEGGDCSRRMVRGGSFKQYEADLRVARRQNFNSRTKINTIGFRVVRVN
ncbi:formylglycine-generating enzyme family protein [Beggiatoa leptomitoformis]|uniref:SUMF1/EgtB/PvdO family nonheme iron enzyme n=1 Tax=Beggiatoa leptomitoformis TaxID=288004 RepID=A0A650GCY5_9GAMM|nr:formylglycine-generating enzyme family protein [Beggiatoa leptomitoformis]QGX03748.1 SUMF1/EgtB/PvdO family nonheme iron enzyme [Beggiatoa leptomitoformis]QGX04110.1 SUMF1/EgtB/PvdO family nonheme iron enzyme [Beggiatoa leptomitoformis]